MNDFAEGARNKIAETERPKDCADAKIKGQIDENSFAGAARSRQGDASEAHCQ
jgi:hypothetical protein